MKSNTIKGAIIFVVYVFLLSLAGRASTNDLPAAAGGALSVDSNGFIRTPPGFLATNGVARVNPAVLLYDETFDGWGTADGITWTNSTGWTSTAVVTNGVCDLSTASLVTPWITGRGLEAISVTWSNLYLLTWVIEYSTNDVDWMTLSNLTDLRIAAAGFRVRFTATGSLPPPGSVPLALLDRVMIWGHQFPGRIGGTNDCAGLVFRVDNPVGSRDAVNLQTLEARLSAYVMGGHSAEGWSQFAASNDVDLSGHTLKLDSRFTLSVVGDAVAISLGGSTLLDMIGGNTCTPRIVSFQVAGTNLSAEVIGVTGWRPYPQWSTSLTSPSWTTLSTNEFTSTFPDITNGAFQLSWSAGTNAVEYWRILAEDETGGTNGAGLATFHVPVSVPALWVGGREVSPYSPTWVSNADHAATADMATTATTASHADTARSSQMSTSALTAAYATSAGNASTAGYANDAAHSARADSSATSAYSTNSRSSATSTYSTNAGYATSAGYAATAGAADNAANGIVDGSAHAFGNAAVLSSNRIACVDQSNTYSLWTTQRCDAVEILDSVIVTNVSILTNLLVSGSANPSPNGIYWQLGTNAWAYTNSPSGGHFYHYGEDVWGLQWNEVIPFGFWTNSAKLGNYNPYCTYDGSSWTNTGVAAVSIYNITTNTTYTTNRTVRMRLNGAGLELQGTNAAWRAVSVITGVLTNGSGAVTGLVSNLLHYLGAP